MSGFLSKKKDFIDFKISELGIDKLSRSKFNIKYYTFSDSSIFYQEDLDLKKNFKISRSKESFLPFENCAIESLSINPEISLENTVNFNQKNAKFLLKTAVTDKTVSDNIIEKKFIDDATINLNSANLSSIKFQIKKEDSQFDFKNKTFIRRYPTIKFLNSDISNESFINEDLRFKHKIRNKFLPPIINDQIEEDEALKLPIINYIFKSYETDKYSVEENDDRNTVIEKVVRALSEDNNVFKLDYKLDESNKKEEDIYLFEIHKVITNSNLEKLCFVKLSEYIDSKTNKNINVYLIGKIFLTRNIKDFIDLENNRLNYSIDNDYSFINMFTLVVE